MNIPVPIENITPCVSVILTTFNRVELLSESVDSILKQTYNDFELIISDNGSLDETPSICQSFQEKDIRVKYYRYNKKIPSRFSIYCC